MDGIGFPFPRPQLNKQLVYVKGGATLILLLGYSSPPFHPFTLRFIRRPHFFLLLSLLIPLFIMLHWTITTMLPGFPISTKTDQIPRKTEVSTWHRSSRCLKFQWVHPNLNLN